MWSHFVRLHQASGVTSNHRHFGSFRFLLWWKFLSLSKIPVWMVLVAGANKRMNARISCDCLLMNPIPMIIIIDWWTQTSAEMRALSSPPTTPLRGDSSLTRSQSSSAKVKRRSRSKSPFRSFRWKRSSTTADQSDEEEGICFISCIISYIRICARHSLSTESVIKYDWRSRRNPVVLSK